MYTLHDALRVLVRLGVEPGEIDIPRDMYSYIVRQARELEEEEVEEAEDENE